MEENSIGFESLPMEIIIEIYRYLDIEDIQAASQTCRHWFAAASFDEFNKLLMIKFAKVLLSDILVPVETFLHTFRSFHHLYLERIFVEDFQLCLKKLGQSLQTITFDGVVLQSDEFCTIIENLINLRKIKITSTSKILNDKNFLINPEDIAKINYTMSNIEDISISLTTPEIESLEKLFSLVTKLKALSVDFAFLNNLNETTKIATCLKKTILNNFTTLKELSLMHIVDTIDLLDTITICNGFYLTKLRCIDVTPWRSLLIFITTQNNLIELDISESKQISDANIRLLVKFIQNLRVLKLKRCLRITDTSLIEIADKLKKLRSLDISYCERLTSYGIKESIANKVNETFEEIYLAGLELHTSSILKLCRNLKNLKILDIGHCMGVTNCIVQRIIMDLIRLKKLNLENCKLISDYALTGINEDGVDEGFSIKRLMHLQCLNLKGCKQITDISFLKNIKLIELKEICLPNIAICCNDIRMLAENCPSLVKLDLSECETMENCEKVMESFTNFKRLKEFKFSKFHIHYLNRKL